MIFTEQACHDFSLQKYSVHVGESTQIHNSRCKHAFYTRIMVNYNLMELVSKKFKEGPV